MKIESPHFGKISSLCLAHLLNDWYMNYLQTMLPFLLAAGLGVSKGAFLISAFMVTSSVVQPFTGYLLDQKNQRWPVYVGTLWMAVLLSLVGVLKNYYVLAAVVALSGLGTASFHPQASAMVTALSGDRKGFFLAFFITCGNVGWAMTPLIAIPVVQAYGLETTPFFALPGIAVAILLWFTAPKISPAKKAAPSPIWSVLRANWIELGKIVLVVTVRSLAFFGLAAFLPLYLKHLDVPLVTGGRMVFLMLFAGAAGGLIGGYLSDIFGRKVVIVWSQILSTPLFFLFLHSSGIMSHVLLALAGATLMASFSVTVVVAQEVISRNAAMASGIMLGLGVGAGGLGVGLMGMVVESAGIECGIGLLVCCPLLAGLLATGLKVGRAPSVAPARG
ncbi:MAG: MFS transporter [Syntrophobacteraceae bacterium]